MILHDIDWQAFLDKYWHKAPVVIKGAFYDFQDPISADELAGLSMEPDADSRLITSFNHQWKVQHGPFDEETLTQLPDSDWQLVVQAANHWQQEFIPLLDVFSSLPQWLFDDLMVCFSTKGGGVGPHIDQYDVFIVQGSGSRRWQVGKKDTGQYQEVIQDDALKQISGFDPIIDQILSPGDMLYIPPGFPHCGDTLEPSMSYSIGYRSPKRQELLSHFADHIIDQQQGWEHLHNPQMSPQARHHLVNKQAISHLSTMMTSLLEEPKTQSQFLGKYLSQSRHHLEIYPPESRYDRQNFADALLEAKGASKVLGLKTILLETDPDSLFINGETYDISNVSSNFVLALCEQADIDLEQIETQDEKDLLMRLVNLGYWYL